ncbi:hypothetical protein MSG28_015379 [Choristoneura fumiferana]|uniref:Uncharacterized protein n=1 Tax=Choristoneura fumiferana TaxID=7141 RepID=A0ACC0KA92_CHOFU|nr:hypothetical protein MSG28_015379 [Choristoneura fumiferana]
MPMEIELVIRDHPGVLDVCVLGVPHPDDGKRAIACVMRTPGSRVTEQEIKDLVAGLYYDLQPLYWQTEC